MNFEKDDVVILNGETEYLIVDTMYYNSSKYLYLAKMDGSAFSIVRLENRDNSIGLSKLSDEEYGIVLDLFNKQINNN